MNKRGVGDDREQGRWQGARERVGRGEVRKGRGKEG